MTTEQEIKVSEAQNVHPAAATIHRPGQPVRSRDPRPVRRGRVPRVLPHATARLAGIAVVVLDDRAL